VGSLDNCVALVAENMYDPHPFIPLCSTQLAALRGKNLPKEAFPAFRGRVPLAAGVADDPDHDHGHEASHTSNDSKNCYDLFSIYLEQADRRRHCAANRNH